VIEDRGFFTSEKRATGVVFCYYISFTRAELLSDTSPKYRWRIPFTLFGQLGPHIPGRTTRPPLHIYIPHWSSGFRQGLYQWKRLGKRNRPGVQHSHIGCLKSRRNSKPDSPLLWLLLETNLTKKVTDWPWLFSDPL
jgi:hypothetical protein